MSREDRFTNTEADAAAYERHRAGDDVDDRPTLAELDRGDAQWEPGDPCFACGSTNTVNLWDGLIFLGAHCNGCGRDDYADD